MGIEAVPRLSVDLIVEDELGRILLGKVSSRWQEGGKYLWGLPGREVLFGEDLRASAERNLREELDLGLVSARAVAVNSNFAGGSHYVAVGVLVTAEGIHGNPRPEDWLEWRWFDRAALPLRLFPSAEATLRSFLGGSLSLDFDARPSG